jgi:hypothetical protein
MSQPLRLSVPDSPRRPPRPVSDEELRGLLAIADVLIPGTSDMPAASAAPKIDDWLGVALAARRDVFDEVLMLATSLGRLPSAMLSDELRRLSDAEPERFEPLSAVIAGAYLMVPEVRRAIGYPGQVRRFPPFDQAAEEITSGILDPVIERGIIQESPGR